MSIIIIGVIVGTILAMSYAKFIFCIIEGRKMNIYLISLTGKPNQILWRLGCRVSLHRRFTNSIVILKYALDL